MEKNGKRVDMKKWVSRVRTTQAQLKSLIQDGGWMEDARQYLERQGKEVQKLINSDLAKVKTFVERERRELERLQKQIPGEVSRWKKYLASQRKELEKVLAGVRGASGGKKTKKGRKSAKVAKKKTSAKKASSRKSAATAGSVSQ
jgi:hypothetical protein